MPINLILVIVTWTVILFVPIILLIRQNKELRKRLHNASEALKKVASGPDPSDTEVKDETRSVFDGYVQKTERGLGNRRTTSFTLSNKMPAFTSIDEALGFGLGLLSKPENPFLADIEGWGSVMRLDDYISMKIVLKNVLNQIKNLGKK